MVLVEQTVTYLEMTSPDQLIPGRLPPADVALDSVGASALTLIRSTHDRIAAPHQWSTLEWSQQRWKEVLSSPTLRSWIARVDGDIAGLVQFETQPEREVEIRTFGLVPEFVGLGFGGHLLTLAIRLAWNFGEVDRVWLHTSSRDHPHALANYRNRGFHPFLVEHKLRELPT